MKSNIKLYLTIFILIIYITRIISSIYNYNFKYTNDLKENTYTVFVMEKNKESEESISYIVKLKDNVSGKYHDTFIININENKFSKEKLNISKYSKFKYGDILVIEGKIKKAEKLGNPGEFNYQSYLNSKGIYGQLNTYKHPIAVGKYSGKSITVLMYKCVIKVKGKIEANVEKALGEKKGGILKSIVYGEKEDLDEKLKENFTQVGVSHLISASGSNISVFINIIVMLIGIKNKRSLALNIVLVPFVLIFMAICNFELTILRAGIQAIFNLIYSALKRKNNKYLPFIFSILLMIYINPMSILNTGLQLSFLASLAILVIYKNLKILYSEVLQKHIKRVVLRKVAEYILDIFTITISVQLLILPVQLNSFNTFNLIIFFSNVIATIISVPIILFGMLGVVFSFFDFAYIFFSLSKPYILILEFAIDKLKSLSMNISIKSLPEYIYLIYYILVFTCVFHSKIKVKLKDPKLNLVIRTVKILQSLALILLILWFNIYSKYFDDFVYFFNVGQGEMSYISYNNKKVMIDMGSMSDTLAFNVINSYFKSQSISDIDILIISHMHKDHVNGVQNFLKKHKVGLIVCVIPENQNDEFRNLKQAVEESKTNIKTVKSGEKMHVGEIKIDILSPKSNKEYGKEALNENSLVCKVYMGSMCFLYTGDITKEVEENLIEEIKGERIDVLKVSHHGSKTGTSENFIAKIKPKTSIVSAKKSYYGHPHENVINILEEYKSKIYMTEKIGAIKIKIK